MAITQDKPRQFGTLSFVFRATRATMGDEGAAEAPHPDAHRRGFLFAFTSPKSWCFLSLPAIHDKTD